MNKLKKFCSEYSCYILYSCAFFVIALIFSNIYRTAGRNFIAVNDGISQHFNTLIYTDKYVHSILGGLFGQGDISAPMMNYTLGQGIDVIIALMGYDLLNPVSMISVLLFGKNLFLAYKFMVFANLFLAGFCFCLYCRTIGRRDGIIIASGALIYAFSGFAVNFCTRHPNFMSGIYYLPLILISAELLIRKNKKLPLVLTIFFSLMTSYYSFYMVAICFVIYILLRFFPCQKSEIKGRILAVVKVGIVSAVGVSLAAVWLFPAAFGTLFNNGGYQTSLGYSESRLHYPISYYKTLLEYFTLSSVSPGYKNYLGFFPIALICIVTLFVLKNKALARLRTAFCLGFFGMCIPLVGLAMNGFRYPNNRWTYAFAFIVAFIFVETAGELPEIKGRRLAFILAIPLLLIIWWIIDPQFDQMDYIPLALVLISVATVFILGRSFISKNIAKILLFALIVTSAATNIILLYSPRYGGYARSFADADDGYGIYTVYSTSKVSGVADDDDFYRVEMQEERENTENYNNVNGTTFYGGTIDKNYQQYYSDMQLSSCSNFVQTLGLSGCAALLDLASVKYFTIPSEEAAFYVPYGYVESSDLVFENTHYLAPAFLYDKYIAYDDFKNRNPVDRQRAMLQGAVLERDTDSAALTLVETKVDEVMYEQVTDNVYLPPGEIFADEGGGTLTLEFETQPDCELYLWIDGLRYANDTANTAITAVSGYRDEDGVDYGVSKSTLMTTPRYEYYLPRDGVCFNLGYSERGYNFITINFEGNDKFGYNGIHVISNPMNTYDEDILRLQNAACENIKIDNDTVFGTVECDKNCLLQLSVPYSVGWKAYIDGERTDVLRSNIMYSALELSPGTHEILMKYSTPYITRGAVQSLETLIFIIVFLIVENSIKKRKRLTKK